MSRIPKTGLSDSVGTEVKFDTLVESLPTTGTFHHLGHEGKVFLHSDRHDNVANGGNLDILIRVPAGNSERQVHLRFHFVAKADTGTLDVDVIIYKGVTVSADGTPETIVSNNDANVKTTGVLMFKGPTVTDTGTYKAQVYLAGEKKGGGSEEQLVPEWVLAPDGASKRDYLIRATNNSGGTADIVASIMFYDSEAT